MVRTLVALLLILVPAQPVRALVLDDFATAQSLTLQWDGLASDETPNQTPGSFAAPFRQLQMTFSQYATGDVVRVGAGSGIGAVEKIAGGTNQVFVESARFVYQSEGIAAGTVPGTPFVDLTADGATRFELDVLGFDVPTATWEVAVCYPSVAFPPARCAIVSAFSNLQPGVNLLDFSSFAFAPEIDFTRVTRIMLGLQSHIASAGTPQGTIPPTAEGSGVFVSAFRTGGQSSTSTTTVASSTSSSTTIPPSTTSTTLPTDPCVAVPPGPTFTSIACRLGALLARVQGEPALGPFQKKLGKPLEKAVARHAEATDFCVSSDLKRSQKRLKKVTRALAQFTRRLDGKGARDQLDPTLRTSLLADGDLILADVTALRSTVVCPGDG